MTAPRKALRFERRTRLSDRGYYNRPGEWCPRLIVWPEYDGAVKSEYPLHTGTRLDDKTDAEWGVILAEAVARFRSARRLDRCTAFYRGVFGTGRYRTHRQGSGRRTWLPGHGGAAGECAPTAAYFNRRQHHDRQEVVFLLHRDPLSRLLLPRLRAAPWLDRGNLLPLGDAILAPGIGEPVLEIALPDGDGPFLEALEAAARGRGHELRPSDHSYLSQWVTADAARARAAYGDRWDVF